MPSLSFLFVEPIYRLIYGRPPGRSGESGADPPRGLVLVVGGVGGLDLCGVGLRHVVGAARLPYTVEVFPWGHGFGRWYADLSDVANRDHRAEMLAEAIRRFRAEHPNDPVYLVAKSGGAGIAAKALERLDEDSVERAVLLAPALSPGYDLTAALRAVRREMVVFWSPLDVVILGAGTRLFGTIDRVRTFGAGLLGFRMPGPDGTEEQRRRQYAKLRQVRWRPGMAGFGYLGGHVGPDSPRFLRKCVVPLLREEGDEPRGPVSSAVDSSGPASPAVSEDHGQDARATETHGQDARATETRDQDARAAGDTGRAAEDSP